jgi:histidine triad (HIT) family protein
VNCIFCEIALGNAPAQIVHRTPEVLVIVPIEPVVDGHLLVLPQKHSVDIFDTTSDTLAYLMTVTFR